MSDSLYSSVPTIDDIHEAARRIRSRIRCTPLLHSALVNAELGFELYLKAECLQVTHAFKARGALNAVLQIDEPDTEIVAWSSGNHAQAVAFAAHAAERHATVVIPRDAPRVKRNACQAWGADIIDCDRLPGENERIGRSLARERHAMMIPPFDDARVIAGQGTVGLELLEQLGADSPDVLLIPCSGGGLASGTALAVRDSWKDCAIVVAEPEQYDDIKQSLESGSRASLTSMPPSLCDALLSRTPGEITFALGRRVLDSGVAASDAQALAAVRFLYENFRLIAEPSGAVAMAAVLARRAQFAGKRVAVVVSGGNVETETFVRALRGQDGSEDGDDESQRTKNRSEGSKDGSEDRLD